MAFTGNGTEINVEAFTSLWSTESSTTVSDYMYHIKVASNRWMTVLTVIFGTLAIFLNGMTMICIRKFKYLHTPTNIFIMSLAASDITTAPGIIANRFLHNIPSLEVMRSIGGISLALVALSFNMSLFHMTAIAFDRLIAVKFPLYYNQSMTIKKACVTIACLWLYGIFTLFLLTIYYTQLKDPVVLRKQNFIVMLILPRGLVLFFIVVQILTCIIICIFVYGAIFWILHRRNINVGNISAENSNDPRKAAKAREIKRMAEMMAIVVLALIICWAPLNILVYTIDRSTIATTPWALIFYTLCTMLLYVNCFINPCIYAWRSSMYRRAYMHLLTCGTVNQPAGTSQTA